MTPERAAARLTELALGQLRNYLSWKEHSPVEDEFFQDLCDTLHNLPTWMANGEDIDVCLRRHIGFCRPQARNWLLGSYERYLAQ